MSTDEYFDKRRKRYIQMKSVYDYGMGFIILGIGLAIAYLHKTGKWDFSQIPGNDLVWPFVVLFVLYGGFRIYRGYKKNY